MAGLFVSPWSPLLAMAMNWTPPMSVVSTAAAPSLGSSCMGWLENLQTEGKEN